MAGRKLGQAAALLALGGGYWAYSLLLADSPAGGDGSSEAVCSALVGHRVPGLQLTVRGTAQWAVVASETCSGCSIRSAADLVAKMKDSEPILIVSERSEEAGVKQASRYAGNVVRLASNALPREAWLTAPYVLRLDADGIVVSCSDRVSR